MDNIQKYRMNQIPNSMQIRPQDGQFFRINLDLPMPAPTPNCIFPTVRKRDLKHDEKFFEMNSFSGIRILWN